MSRNWLYNVYAGNKYLDRCAKLKFISKVDLQTIKKKGFKLIC